VYSGRTTGITVSSHFLEGKNDYRLGVPLIFLLLRIFRKPSTDRFMKVAGWLFDKLKGEKQYFRPRELSLLRRYYFNIIIRKMLDLIKKGSKRTSFVNYGFSIDDPL
jgi:hypothetical protein